MPRKRGNNAAKSTEHSSAKSMLSDVEKMLGLDGLFRGEITHCSFDCPLNLRKALKAEAKANGTSVCKILQYYGALYVANSRLKKHASGNTLSKFVDANVNVSEINFLQYVQTRPRRKIKEPVDNDEETKPKLATTQIQAKNEAEKMNKTFAMVADQWNIHPDPKWRSGWIDKAEAWKDKVFNAKLVLALGGLGQ